MLDIRTLLARNMKQYRKIQKMSQATLAYRVGCSTTFIGNIEIKKSFPSPENIDNIARVLAVKQADLFLDNVGSTVSAATIKVELKKEINETLRKKLLETIDNVIKEI